MTGGRLSREQRAGPELTSPTGALPNAPGGILGTVDKWQQQRYNACDMRTSPCQLHHARC